MKRYKHFLLTRFNVPFIRKENIDFLFEKQYLDNRFDIFKKCCFSSIKQQTNQDFIWIVFFDSRTPDAYKEINKSLNQEYNNYCPVYIDIENLPNGNNFYDNEALKATSKKNIDDLTYSEKIQKISLAAEISRIINSFCGEEDDLIVTTRIDNDDAFHKDMMKEVIKTFLIVLMKTSCYCLLTMVFNMLITPISCELSIIRTIILQVWLKKERHICSQCCIGIIFC